MIVRHIASNLCRAPFTGAAWLLALALTGCHGTSSEVRKDSPPPTDGNMVIKAGHIQDGPATPTYPHAEDMAKAEEFYKNADYKQAQYLFEDVADDMKKTPPAIAEKARFFEAECQRMRLKYVDAAHTFNRLLQDFNYGVYKEKAVSRIFEIANFWLDDTRRQLEAEREKAAGKRMFVPSNFVNFDKRKPLLDEEGNALKMMEAVYYNDPTGPKADEALYIAGYVQFNRGNFKAADQLLTTLIEMDDRNRKTKSKFRNHAIEMCILAKNNSTGGAAYDPRKLADSLKLINDTRSTNPEMLAEKGGWLDRQAEMIRYMQAEKDYEIADFYRRTGQPASAWFYYELVRRRYKGTEFHDKAVACMTEIRNQLHTHEQRSDFEKTVHEKWNMWAWGHQTPSLSGQQMPKTPEGFLENQDSKVMRAQAKELPSDSLPK